MSKQGKVCTYDNPATMRRELWQNGKLVCDYSFEMVEQFDRRKRKISWPEYTIHIGANTGPFEEGQMVGDPEAIGEQG